MAVVHPAVHISPFLPNQNVVSLLGANELGVVQFVNISASGDLMFVASLYQIIAGALACIP